MRPITVDDVLSRRVRQGSRLMPHIAAAFEHVRVLVL
jgi:hypothetical protein